MQDVRARSRRRRKYRNFSFKGVVEQRRERTDTERKLWHAGMRSHNFQSSDTSRHRCDPQSLSYSLLSCAIRLLQTSIRSTYAILFSFPPARSLIRTPPLKSTWTRTFCIPELWYNIVTRWNLILQESYYKGIDFCNKCYHSMTLFYRYKRCYWRMLFAARLVVMHFCEFKFPINA